MLVVFAFFDPAFVAFLVLMVDPRNFPRFVCGRRSFEPCENLPPFYGMEKQSQMKNVFDSHRATKATEQSPDTLRAPIYHKEEVVAGQAREDERAVRVDGHDQPRDTSKEAQKPANDGSRNEPSKGSGSGKSKDPSPATQLLALTEGMELFHAPDGRAFATLEENGHHETWEVRGQTFSQWLQRRFFRLTEGTPSKQAMQDALSVLEARARFDGPSEPVHVRVAEKDGAVYLDLGAPDWRAVEITPRGWQIVATPPVKFARHRGMEQLPTPVPGGHISELRPYVNVGSDEAFVLLVSWLVGAMRPSGPYAIAVLQGEQASAKSTTARVLRRLIDPSTAPVRGTPRDVRDLMITAQNGWVLAYDNLSGLPVWLSDALCCIATGAGQSTRRLRTDADEVIFSASRPIIMNGIDAIAERADLADRSMVITLPPIPEDKRQDEATFRASFERTAPRILGALLDGVSTALRNIHSVTLPYKPRMADFALWATAAETSFGWTQGTFIKAYSENKAQAVEISLDADLVATAVRDLLEHWPSGTWEGSATELHAVLRGLVPQHALRTRDWPQAPNALTNRLRRVAPAMRAVGIICEDLPRSGKTGMRKLRLRRIAVQSIVRTVSTVTPAEPTADVTAATPNAVDGRISATVSQVAGDRQSPVAGKEAGFATNPVRADGAAGTDGPRTGSAGEAAQPLQIHRDATGLPALAAAIVAAGQVGLLVDATGPDMRLDTSRAVGISLPTGEVHVIDLVSTGDLGPVKGALRQVLIVGHDLKPALARLVSDFDLEPGALFDTMIAHKLLDGGQHLGDEAFFGLARTCEEFLGLELPKGPREQAAAAEPISDARIADLAQRVRPLLRLEAALRDALEYDKMADLAALESRVIPVVISMERTGVPFDRQRFEEVINARAIEADSLRATLHAALKIQDVDNAAEVLTALQRRRIPVARTESEDLAPYMNVEVIEQLVRYRDLTDFWSSVSKGVHRALSQGRGNRVRPVLDQLGHASVRFSCGNPNVLGVPREPDVRGCIQAVQGTKLVVSEYSAIELRVLADRIDDEQLIKAFQAGGDPYRRTASLLMGVTAPQVTAEQRQIAEAATLGFSFGMGPEAFVMYARKSYGIKVSVEQATALQARFLAAHPAIAGWQARMRNEASRQVSTASGRIRYFRDPSGEYEARLSHAVRGTIADGIKKALVLLHNDSRFRELGGRILLVLDGALLVEAPEAHAEEVRKIVAACMVAGMTAFVKAVPVVVEADVRERWAKEAGTAQPSGQASDAEKRRREQHLFDSIVEMFSDQQFEALAS
ncbi:DNA polymerase [Polyangium aurulentum]|uniref:DNA polymerase n=1 Tax=Polyangium aurulentum TaxID=2567896 RepID=UPI0010ADAF14|nr:DNA polymerase [Polyangium aurulentum]UQA57137.1 hypothetical protein E8A73_038480 [Polyangium aurulentum]